MANPKPHKDTIISEKGTVYAPEFANPLKYSVMFYLGYIFIGLLGGIAANRIESGSLRNLWINLIVGVLGAAWGGWAFSLLGIIPEGSWPTFVTSVLGCAALLWILSQVFVSCRRE